jgi:ABC-type Fe3+-hydroxamate transport system substrate-binding protein
MKIPSLPVHFRVAGGDGILVFRSSKTPGSPRSGRLKIAQRFIAGIRSGSRILVREADDRPPYNRPANPIILSPVSRARDQIISDRPSTEGAGLFSFVRFADFGTTCVLGILLSFALVATASCRKTEKSLSDRQTREVTDEAGRRVLLPNKIDRIVSLAPNLTEIVYAIGAGDRLVGRTSYCDYPPQAKSVTEVGDTMHPSIERIITLKPQIVLVSTASQLESFTKQLDEQKIAVYVTNPTNLDEIFLSIERLGELFGTSETAKKLADELRRRTQKVEAAVASTKPVRVFYQVSGEPLYTIGRDAYLTDLIKRAGGVSVTGDVPGAFPRYSDEAALASKPDAIILPTGGSMGEANSTVISALKDSPAVLNGHVYKINGDLLSRPGPRLVDGLEAMARALHPDAFK